MTHDELMTTLLARIKEGGFPAMMSFHPRMPELLLALTQTSQMFGFDPADETIFLAIMVGSVTAVRIHSVSQAEMDHGVILTYEDRMALFSEMARLSYEQHLLFHAGRNMSGVKH